MLILTNLFMTSYRVVSQRTFTARITCNISTMKIAKLKSADEVIANSACDGVILMRIMYCSKQLDEHDKSIVLSDNSIV